jgi:hypothetical protein
MCDAQCREQQQQQHSSNSSSHWVGKLSLAQQTLPDSRPLDSESLLAAQKVQFQVSTQDMLVHIITGSS